LASSGEEIDGFLEIQGKPSTEEETVNSIRDNVSWMSPIIRYLKEGKLPTDKTEAHKLRIRASRFQLLGALSTKWVFRNHTSDVYRRKKRITSSGRSMKEFVEIIQGQELWHTNSQGRVIIGLPSTRYHTIREDLRQMPVLQ
jgi:hypothetical protein